MKFERKEIKIRATYCVGLNQHGGFISKLLFFLNIIAVNLERRHKNY